MSQIITFKGRLVRISPKDSSKIETSPDGRNWSCIHSSSYPGYFQDLVVNGNYIYGTTNNGLYFSPDGVNWSKRS